MAARKFCGLHVTGGALVRLKAYHAKLSQRCDNGKRGHPPRQTPSRRFNQPLGGVLRTAGLSVYPQGVVKGKMSEYSPMTHYLVTYDLDQPGQQYDRLVTYLETIGAYRFQKSAWYASYAGSANDLKTALSVYLDRNDKIEVAEANVLNRAGSDPNLSLLLAPPTGLLSQQIGLGGPFSKAAAKQPGILGNSLLGSYIQNNK